MPIRYIQALPIRYNGPFSEKFFSKGVAYKVQWVMLKKIFSIFFYFFIVVTGFCVYIRHNLGGILADVIVCFQLINHLSLIFIITLVGLSLKICP